MKANIKETTFELYINEKRQTSDLAIYECGWEKCNPDHCFGPIKRDYYLLHYITKGAGTYVVDQISYPLKEGMFFLIVPEKNHRYFADPKQPYEYYWIGFHGLEALKMIQEAYLENQYVFTIQNQSGVLDLFEEIRRKDKNDAASKYFLLSAFYKLWGYIVEDRKVNINFKDSSNKEFIGNVMKYIQLHYGEDINVTKLSKMFNINRSHLYRIFNARMQISLEQYIINTRLANSLILLKNRNLSFKEVALQVGFKDYSNFLKAFKKKYQITPKQYRKDPFETEHL